MSHIHSARSNLEAQLPVSFVHAGSNLESSAARVRAAGRAGDQLANGPDLVGSAEVRGGLAVLLQGYHYARRAGRTVWDFAVEIEDLKSNGLTNNDLRWMVCQGWIEQARELTDTVEGNRVFAFGSVLTFSDRSCFVLSKEGVRIAERVPDSKLLAGPETPSRIQHERPDSCVAFLYHGRPRWDPECHRLYVGNVLVKEFKLPSPNQGTVLMAFEEDDWPQRIDDPLPPSGEVDPKLRLRSTIKSLNRNQKKRLIRFMGDGSGQGIIWERSDGEE